MKRKNIKIIVAVVMVIFTMSNLLSAQTGKLFKSRGGLISDVKANKIGDIVTIIISESSTASNVSNTQTSKSNQMDMEGAFGNNFLRNLNGSISSTTSNQYSGNGTVTSSGSFTTRLTARITNIEQDGNFLIRGTREVSTNGEKVVTIVEGLIRPEDITSSNTISSALIADAKIFHQGKGVTTEARKPGLVTRIFNWIF